MKKQYFLFCFLLIFSGAGLIKVYAQPNNEKAAPDPAEINKLRLAIEQNPADLDLHDKYLKATGFSKWGAEENQEFIKQYEEWMVKFPKSAAVAYALGHAFASKESPKAKPYLLKAVEIDPKFDKAWFDLWIDGERWGDFKVSRSYLAKAKEAAPTNPDYAFYYANGFKESDFNKYKQLSFAVARDFPNTERGAQALYWLANRVEDRAEKAVIYEQQKKEFPPEKFNWSASGMSDYFSLLLIQDPAKAVAHAEYMISLKPRDVKSWENNQALAKVVAEIKTLMNGGKAVEAATLVEKMVMPRYSAAKEDLLLLKAKVMDASGNTAGAYKILTSSFAKEPTAAVEKAMVSCGGKLGKNPVQVNNDALYIRDTAAKVAPNFVLDQYFKEGTSALSDYKGKVVLLTYWFPGCGPCRGEFPHFENVVKKFKGKDFVYLGINIVPDQDDYVLPFMKSSGYSFIPLRDNKNWEKGPLDNRNAAPVNFLIDQNGKIIFSNFRTDHKNEATLEMMIRSMLEKKAA